MGAWSRPPADGLLVEFGSVVDAVECAVEWQRLVARRNADMAEDRRIVFRIGSNLGDIIIGGDDIHGDGVNIAARLEAMAEPGGIYISGAVHNQLKAKLPLGYADLGAQTVKAHDEPVRAFRVRLDAPAAAGKAPARPEAAAEQRSIAVRPFDTFSADPKDAMIADGLVEGIIADLSRLPELRVIARNSTFAFKGRAARAARSGSQDAHQSRQGGPPGRDDRLVS